jgi:O-antigen ligase
MNLFNKTFKTTLLFIIFLELLSFCAYAYPTFNKTAFLIILLVTLILSLIKLEYGLYIVLAELFIGSKGYLFYFELGGTSVSIRIGLFLILMSVWLFNIFRSRLKINSKTINNPKNITTLQNHKIPTTYWLLFLAIIWGILYGLLRGNSFNNIFFDANAWLYFAYIFPFLSVFKTKEQLYNIISIFSASLIDIILKSLFSLWIFSHQIIGISYDLYRWLRMSGVGEVTPVAGNFYRVFFQSQIYALIGFFIVLCLAIDYYWYYGQQTKNTNVIPNEAKRSEGSREQRIKPRDSSLTLGMTFTFLLSFFSFLTITISFSRSFWLGLLGGLALMFVALKLIFRETWARLLKLFGILILAAILNFGFLYLFISFPPTAGDVSLASLIGDRASPGDAAGSSRKNLLVPLLLADALHPIIGSGFGTTVTYKTLDPRILASSPNGIYTTYAFEWGYLDIWLKIGLAGLLIYLYLIWQIVKKGIARLMTNDVRLTTYDKYLTLGLLLGLIALLITNIFTPYLNHPLGIGYIILLSVAINIFQENKIHTNP